MSKWEKHVTHAFIQVVGKKHYNRSRLMPVAELRLTLSLEPTLWVRGHQSIYLFGYTAKDLPH